MFMFDMVLPVTLSVNMLNVLFLILGVAPSVIIIALVANKNRHLYMDIAAVFLCGAVSVFAAGRLENWIKAQWQPNGAMEMVAYYFLVVGLIEEICKWASYKIIIRHDDVEHRYEYIIFTVAAACGFAALENVLYLRSMDIGVAFIRALCSVPCHAIDCVVMGAIISKSHYCYKKSDRALYNILGIAGAAIMHGLYDSVIVVTNSWICIFAFEAVAVIIAGFLIARVKYIKR